MGESIIGRPIGPSYVPGTLAGQSSANAPAPAPPQITASALPDQTIAPAPAQQLNPAQFPRFNLLASAIGQRRPPSTIGPMRSLVVK